MRRCLVPIHGVHDLLLAVEETENDRATLDLFRQVLMETKHIFWDAGINITLMLFTEALGARHIFPTAHGIFHIRYPETERG
jgi:hypothetical protein